MIKGRNSELASSVFLFFAIFPEDIPVPAGFFYVVTPLLADYEDKKKANLLIGRSLSTLLKFNLLKGSLSVGSGVFMHDIVRDYVIHQHSPEELRALQKSVLGAILAARPEPDGFPTSAFAAPGTFEGYVSRQLYWHFRGALEEGEDPPDAWLAHPDSVIKANVAMALGLDTLMALSDRHESAGELVRAAQASWAGSLLKSLSQSMVNDLVYRAADLLERADDKEELYLYV